MYRELIVGIDTPVPLAGGQEKAAINFDNAATTPPLLTVLQEIMRFSPWYSSVHRGGGYKSQVSSRLYESSRDIVMEFVKADNAKNLAIYVKNTTEAINLLAHRLWKGRKQNVILSSSMEHHSNDLPWRKQYEVDYIRVASDGRLSLEDLHSKLRKHKGTVRLVTICGVSNVTGYINPIHKAARLAHAYGVPIMVDAAQLTPHLPVDMRSNDSPEHIDFLAFSAHKMYAPFGIGVLIGPKTVFKTGSPYLSGGGTVKFVSPDTIRWNQSPQRDEGGTQNLMGAIALITAMKTLQAIGMQNIAEHEKVLTQYALEQLGTIKGVQIFGDIEKTDDRASIISFNVDKIHHSTLTRFLALEAGIAVRSGCFCAQPYMQKLLNISPSSLRKYIKVPASKRPGLVRISFGFYNTIEEIDTLADYLRIVSERPEFYSDMYSM